MRRAPQVEQAGRRARSWEARTETRRRCVGHRVGETSGKVLVFGHKMIQKRHGAKPMRIDIILSIRRSEVGDAITFLCCSRFTRSAGHLGAVWRRAVCLRCAVQQICFFAFAFVFQSVTDRHSHKIRCKCITKI